MLRGSHRLEAGPFLLAVVVGSFAIACAPDPAVTLIDQKPANVYSYVYLCELGTPGYQSYCDDYGTQGSDGTPYTSCSANIAVGEGTSPFSDSDCGRLRRLVGYMESAYASQDACGDMIDGLQSALDEGKVGWHDLSMYTSTTTSGVVDSGPSRLEIWFSPYWTQDNPDVFALSAFHEGQNETSVANGDNSDHPTSDDDACYDAISNVNGDDWAPRIASSRGTVIHAGPPSHAARSYLVKQ